MKTDGDLLRDYAEKGDQTAFAEVVSRHLDMVYAAAVRLLNGDATLAEDAAQSVFADMAQKADVLSVHANLVGWLHTSARFAASHIVRSEQRRRAREQEAIAMNDLTNRQDINWMHLRPLIDEAVGQLLTVERDAVLLRFFEDKPYREVGEALGLTENAARMKVERAMDKIRAYFSRHGVTTTVALLASTLGAGAARVPAPAWLMGSVTSYAQGVTAASVDQVVSSAGAKKFFTAKVAALLVGAAALGAAGATAWNYHNLAPEPTLAPVVASPMPPPATPVPLAANATPDATLLAAAVLPAAAVMASATPAAVSTVDNLIVSTEQAMTPPAETSTSDTTAPQAPAEPPAPPPPASRPPMPPAPPAKGLHYAQMNATSQELVREAMTKPSLAKSLLGNGATSSIVVGAPMARYYLTADRVADGTWLPNAQQQPNTLTALVSSAGNISSFATLVSDAAGKAHITSLSSSSGSANPFTAASLAAALSQLSRYDLVRAHAYEARLAVIDGIAPGDLPLTAIWLKSDAGPDTDLIYVPFQPRLPSQIRTDMVYYSNNVFNALQPVAEKLRLAKQTIYVPYVVNRRSGRNSGPRQSTGGSPPQPANPEPISPANSQPISNPPPINLAPLPTPPPIELKPITIPGGR